MNGSSDGYDIYDDQIDINTNQDEEVYFILPFQFIFFLV